MDPRVNQEWTSSEVEEARSLVARLSRKDSSYEDSTDKNKKHNDIVDDLHAWFPKKTMQQVTDMYVDLVVEMHMMHWQGGSHGASGSTHVIGTVCDLMNDNFGVSEEETGAARDTHGVYTMGDLVKDSIGVPEEEATTMDGNGLVFGCPLEEIRTMEMEEALPMVEENKIEVLENNIVNHQPVVAPHAGRFWTTEEHRLFLHGLRVYGRGNWKNISKYFVTTRTPVQVSSHAQKYFRRLESRASSGRQRYSINDVGLHDADPWAADDSSTVWQVLAFNGVNHDPRFGLWAPENPFITMNNLAQFLSPFAQFLSPFLYSQQVDRQPSWSEQQMMGSAATPMQGVGNFVPACQQGSAYLPPEQWMDNM